MRERYVNARWAPAVLLLGLLSVGVTTATTAQAGLKLFSGEWYVKAFGNECGGMGTTGPHCTRTTGQSYMYSNWALPQGIECNAYNPLCPYASTPTNGMGTFSPFGGNYFTGMNCTPYTVFNKGPRPAKGQTSTSGPPPTGASRRIPPLYRNPYFFTPLGNPKSTTCYAASTGFTTQNKTRFGKNRGRVQQGNPVAGSWSANTTGSPGKGGFTFAAAPEIHPFGVRTTGQFGGFSRRYPYAYSYTYATLRNDEGVFGPGKGPGSFNIQYPPASAMLSVVASINVKQGAAKFGGTMQMLGALTNKACYVRLYPRCSIGENNWRYDVIGASGAHTLAGVITQGYITTYTANYYVTSLMLASTVTIQGSRFPWTTGSVTVTAKGRGPGNTVQYAHGFDNRNTTTPDGLGTIQLVSPVLTRWFGTSDWETGGIAILRLKFIEALPDDSDGDGVADPLDNCLDVANPEQDDSDGDDCGNVCDADYDNDGVVGYLDAFEFGSAFGGTSDPEKCHVGVIPGCTVGFADFAFFVGSADSTPGPSGTTAGTTACP